MCFFFLIHPCNILTIVYRGIIPNSIAGTMIVVKINIVFKDLFKLGFCLALIHPEIYIQLFIHGQTTAIPSYIAADM